MFSLSSLVRQANIDWLQGCRKRFSHTLLVSFRSPPAIRPYSLSPQPTPLFASSCVAARSAAAATNGMTSHAQIQRQAVPGFSWSASPLSARTWPGVHYLQDQRIGRALLFQAKRAEEQGQTERMAIYLQRYLEFAPHDTAEKARLGQIWTSDFFASSPRTRLKGVDLLTQVLIQEPNQPELSKAVIKVALHPTTPRPKMARDQLQTLWQNAQKAEAQLATKERGELESYWGQLLELEEKPVEAMMWYRQAREHDPEETVNYVRLATLLRRQPESDPRQRETNGREADALMDALVEANQHLYKAYLARWNYRREFDLLRDPGPARDLVALMRRSLPPATVDMLTDRAALNEVILKRAAEDVEAALKRAPEALEVLLAAADMERLKGSLSRDAAAARQHREDARAYLQTGLQLQNKQGNRAATDMAKFQLLWHLANLLLDSRQVAATANAEAPPADDKQDRQELADAADAIDKIRQLRSLPSGAPDYLEGRLFLNQHKWAEAASSRLFEQARPQFTNRGELAYEIDLQLGFCYEKLEEPGLMLAAYERAVKWDPNSTVARLGMGAALWSMDRHEDAIASYKSVLGREQVPPESWLDVARLQVLVQLRREVRDWKEAEAALARAEKATPKLVEVKLLRAEVLAAQGKFKEAEDFLVEALDRTPNEVDFYVARAGLAERDHHPDRAKVVLDAAQSNLATAWELRLARMFSAWLAALGDRARKPLTLLAQMESKVGKRSAGGAIEVCSTVWPKRISSSATAAASAAALDFDGSSCRATQADRCRACGCSSSIWR